MVYTARVRYWPCEPLSATPPALRIEQRGRPDREFSAHDDQLQFADLIDACRHLERIEQAAARLILLAVPS